MAEEQDGGMTPDEAIAMLQEGRIQEWNTYRHTHPGWEPDLSKADLARVNLGDMNLSDADLMGEPFVHPTNLSDANLWGADLREAMLLLVDLRRADLRRADLEGADLSYTKLMGAKLNGANLSDAKLTDANLSDADLSEIDLSRADLEGADLSRANLQGADLSRANLERANLSAADLRRANLSEARLRFARLLGTRGLFGRDSASVKGVRGDEWADYSTRFDRLGWELLRSIGTLRLFGVAYFAIIAIVIFAASVRWYNDGLSALRATYGDEWIWLHQAPMMRMPQQFGWQLLATLALASGATIYQLCCPQIVKEATETRWHRELGHTIIEYGSANYCRLIARYLCGVLYFGGGGYTVVYVGLRVIDTMKYIFAL